MRPRPSSRSGGSRTRRSERLCAPRAPIPARFTTTSRHVRLSQPRCSIAYSVHSTSDGSSCSWQRSGLRGRRGGGVPLQSLVEALIRSDIESAVELEARSEGRARLIGAIYIRPADFVKERVEGHFRPVAKRFLPHLCAAVPHVSNAMLAWRVRWCVSGSSALCYPTRRHRSPCRATRWSQIL